MRTKRKIMENTIAQVLGKILTMGTTVIITAIITRDLGGSGYGQFTLIMGFATFFYLVADFGLNAIVIREITGAEDKTGKYMTALIVLRIILSLVLIIFASLALVFLPYSGIVKTGIMIALLTIITQSLFTSANTIFQMHLEYYKSLIASSAASAVLLLWVVFTSYYFEGNHLLLYVSGYVIHGLILFLVGFYLVSNRVEKLSVQFDIPLVKGLFWSSLPLGLMLLFAQVHAKADIFLLSLLELPKFMSLTTDETLGVYGLGYKVFEVVLVFATFFMNAVYPVFVRHQKISEKRLNESFRMVVLFLLGMGIVSLLLLYITAPYIILLLGGKGFEQSILVLRILSLGLPAFFVSSAFQWYIVTINRQIVLPYIYLMGALVTVLLLLIFIPIYSFVAAAVITWSVEFLILIMLIAYCLRYWRGKSPAVLL